MPEAAAMQNAQVALFSSTSREKLRTASGGLAQVSCSGNRLDAQHIL